MYLKTVVFRLKKMSQLNIHRVLQPPVCSWRHVGTRHKPKDSKKYKEKADTRRMLNIAAKSWADGVPWNRALKIGKDVLKKLNSPKTAKGG